MDFAHLMETFTNPDTIHSLHIYDKMIVSAFSMFIGISITVVTLTLVYIAMKILTVFCNVVLSFDSGNGVFKNMLSRKGATNAGNTANAGGAGGGGAGGAGGASDSAGDDIVAISAAIHAYYAPRLHSGQRIVIRDIRRGEAKARYGVK